MKFSITDFCNKYPQFPADLVTFTEEIRNGKLHFLCSGYFSKITTFCEKRAQYQVSLPEITL